MHSKWTRLSTSSHYSQANWIPRLPSALFLYPLKTHPAFCTLTSILFGWRFLTHYKGLMRPGWFPPHCAQGLISIQCTSHRIEGIQLTFCTQKGRFLQRIPGSSSIEQVNVSHPVNAEVKLCGASTSPLPLFHQVLLVLGLWLFFWGGGGKSIFKF